MTDTTTTPTEETIWEKLDDAAKTEWLKVKTAVIADATIVWDDALAILNVLLKQVEGAEAAQAISIIGSLIGGNLAGAAATALSVAESTVESDGENDAKEILSGVTTTTTSTPTNNAPDGESSN